MLQVLLAENSLTIITVNNLLRNHRRSSKQTWFLTMVTNRTNKTSIEKLSFAIYTSLIWYSGFEVVTYCLFDHPFFNLFSFCLVNRLRFRITKISPISDLKTIDIFIIFDFLLIQNEIQKIKISRIISISLLELPIFLAYFSSLKK